MNPSRPLCPLLILVGSAACAPGGSSSTPAQAPGVLFVCEHGAAKSVIAAALFNARASQRNLPFRATSRGVVPDAVLLPAAVAGLRSDGLTPGEEAPLRVRRDDVAGATVVVAFDPLPPDLAADAPVKMWNAVPPVSRDYAASREAMLPRIDALLDELARARDAPQGRSDGVP